MFTIKKSVLFVIDSLDVAGAEKSLVTLLNLLDFNKYDVDLQLFSYGDALESLVPESVNLLPPFDYTTFNRLSLKLALIESVTKTRYAMLIARMKYSLNIRKGHCGNREKARIYWQCAAQVIAKNPKKYDIAISYAQGVPTFYVADKVTAKKKLAWVNVSYELQGKEKQFQRYYYNQYDTIVAVSESAKNVLLETFPHYDHKTTVFYDINNPAFISSMADIGPSYDDTFTGIRLLTIGRLSHQKGYDVALEACRQLKEVGIHFKWYVLGKGPLKAEIEQSIQDMGLEDHFILLGIKTNPYRLIKEADIYVQTSRFEGFGLAIAEARMLNIPVVTTKFDAVYNQMIHGKNGLVVERDAKSITEAIKSLINNPKLKQQIVHYLQTEKKGNVENMTTFYQLIS